MSHFECQPQAYSLNYEKLRLTFVVSFLVNLTIFPKCYRKNEILWLNTSQDMIIWIARIFVADIVSRLAKFDRVLFTLACIDVRDKIVFDFFLWEWVDKLLSFNLMCWYCGWQWVKYEKLWLTLLLFFISNNSSLLWSDRVILITKVFYRLYL